MHRRVPSPRCLKHGRCLWSMLVAVGLLRAASAQASPAAGSPSPTPTPGPAASLLMWLRPEGLGGDGSRAECSGQAVPVWPNAAPVATAVLLGYDARTPALQSPPVRFFDNATGQCVARFTAAQGTALAAPTLDLSAATASYSVTIVARMWRMEGGGLARVVSGAAPLYPVNRDWLVGWHNGRSDGAYSSSGGWLGGVVDGLVEAGGSRGWTLFTLTRDATTGGAGVLYKNGNTAVAGIMGGGPQGILLGGGFRNWQIEQLSALSDCDVAEVLVHGAVLPTADRQRLEGSLAAKYRMAHRLPGGHPFFAVLVPIPAPTAMPTPLLWLRPDFGLPVSGPVDVWRNCGSGGSGLDAVFAG